jgi:threonine/homoserine/homoserine lactone efflux protein
VTGRIPRDDRLGGAAVLFWLGVKAHISSVRIRARYSARAPTSPPLSRLLNIAGI